MPEGSLTFLNKRINMQCQQRLQKCITIINYLNAFDPASATQYELAVKCAMPGFRHSPTKSVENIYQKVQFFG